MFARCPHCAHVHATEAAALRARQGLLDCPHCGREFDGLAHLADSVEALTADGDGDDADAPLQAEIFATPAPGPASRFVPGFARTRRIDAATATRAGGWLIALMLLCMLLLQIVVADRERLAADADWRPWLETTCNLLRCDLPPWRAPQQLMMTSREVRPHPSVAGALLITATFRNDAPFAQAWPQLELALSDLDGHALALRRFSAPEYLGGAPSTPTLAPGQSASATLEVMDPGNRALAFAFEFR